MLIYAIDDEKIQLLELQDAINTALPKETVKIFQSTFEVLRMVEEEGERPDLVFSDIRMPGINGLRLAVRIKKASPDTKIIFVTGYSQYAMDAFRVHANGYLMKPVRPDDITEEVENLQLPCSRRSDLLTVQCFGNFEVLWHEVPLEFKRRKTKELFAYLIDQEGALCSAEDIAAVLWEDEADVSKAKHRLRNLISDLRSSLKAAGQEAVLIRKSGLLAIKRNSVDCDYYRMLDGDMGEVNSFRGEYMKQYAWAQETEARLHFRQ